jgi:hypothetical protein
MYSNSYWKYKFMQLYTVRLQLSIIIYNYIVYTYLDVNKWSLYHH